MLNAGRLLNCDVHHVGIPEILYTSCAVISWGKSVGKKMWQPIYLGSICPPTSQMYTNIKANSDHANCW